MGSKVSQQLDVGAKCSALGLHTSLLATLQPVLSLLHLGHSACNRGNLPQSSPAHVWTQTCDLTTTSDREANALARQPESSGPQPTRSILEISGGNFTFYTCSQTSWHLLHVQRQNASAKMPNFWDNFCFSFIKPKRQIIFIPVRFIGLE